MYPHIRLLLPTLLILTIAGISSAQKVTVKTDDAWCNHQHDHWNSERARYCEVREITLSPRSELSIDAAPNGGISVRAWDESSILIRALVMANARSESDAEEIARDVTIKTNRTISADGPGLSNQEGFWVSYEVFAPAGTDLDLESQNGGITIEDMTGRTRFSTQNGGVSLSSMAGDVSGETTNGGVTVELEGDSWDGRGLDVETTNGSVSITVPNGYSAELETGTINGRIDVEFPVMVEGRFDRRLNATLGDGGRPIRAVTTNGSVRIKRG